MNEGYDPNECHFSVEKSIYGISVAEGSDELKQSRPPTLKIEEHKSPESGTLTIQEDSIKNESLFGLCRFKRLEITSKACVGDDVKSIRLEDKKDYLFVFSGRTCGVMGCATIACSSGMRMEWLKCYGFLTSYGFFCHRLPFEKEFGVAHRVFVAIDRILKLELL
ncbi:uncharacterized protein MONOS_5380 [Monocercomonoides exilis]|uniref:uncharacterized protein n=1 Tax=Monocercomonoides exilis TaxID=2049356 RepID=UPI003559E6E7|nr:hypothetical protein MONOS_5380 [Monocercomonoides exilis]|eukprot:MONOS_5380.1-p1 / transcript=MONOS_5380.1 / gene=MONOS_5380 / organism=Monocercomonoides_exilis_PA203 / gene_product=unspecified product / transcript_product=unspecified product / location=Mono_scaffold00155:101619-102113(-) / protein_length=165 / sequence_SO=supercontig / SO=protein_coding / is_pseudo=false